MAVPPVNALGSEDVSSLTGARIRPVRFDVHEFDHASNPRDDLDAFVNVHWRATNPVPADRTCWDCFTILAEHALQTQASAAIDAGHPGGARSAAERVVGDFWRSGMDATAINALRIEPLREELARIDTLATPAAIAAYVSDRHARGWGTLFGFEIAPDFDDPATTIACISQDGLGLPDRDCYFDLTVRGQAVLVAYREHVAAMLVRSGVAGPQAHALAVAILTFETRLAVVSLPRAALARDIALRRHRIAIDEADRLCPHFPWSTFFSAQGITPPRHFSLAMPAFHAEVDAMLGDVPAATWRAWLRYRAIDDMAEYLDDDTAMLRQHFHDEILRGQRASPPRWKRVLQAIDAHVGEAMGQLHVARTFSPAAKQSMEELVRRLRAALQMRIERLDWMDDQTRAQALRKLAAMHVKIGCPDHWRDWSELRTSARTWYANILAARAFNQHWMLAKLGKPVDASAWPMLPQTVNAGYDPQRNEIVFPAAILQSPFFDANADVALNFGGIGAVIAHEMTHAFDDQGSRFGADGRFENWWSEADRMHFDERAQALVEQVAARPAADGERVDARLTLGENIADFGGLAIACDALQEMLAATGGSDPMHDGYSQHQRFFLNWALIWRQNLTKDERRLRLLTDAHAPAAMRANVAPANLAAFAEAFTCIPGDAMWRAPEDRAGVW